MWQAFHKAYRGYFSEERAISQATSTNSIERYFTFDNFKRSAERCAREMEAFGLSDVELESFPADGKTNWSGWRAMKAWSANHARLLLVSPTEQVLCDWDEVPQSLVMYSGPASIEADVVLWDGEDRDVEGRIPLTRRRINDVFPQMRSKGIPGVLSDFIGTLPGVREPSDIPDSCRWENSAIRLGLGKFWGFMLTPNKGAMIRELMRSGPVRVRVDIDAGCSDGLFYSATGVIPGSRSADEEILFVSHLYEPGGNDNASGVGCGLEVARSLKTAIDAGAITRPSRSIRFLFNWEGYGLIAWMEKHRATVGNLLGGINIDEIGVDQEKGRSTLHLFMPPAANPSCVGPVLKCLCDQILDPSMRIRTVADRAEIINDTLTSDPNIDVPLPCLIQYPSKHYHSSSDTIDTLSHAVMKQIGLVTATHLYTLANSDETTARWIADTVRAYQEEELLAADSRIKSGEWPFSLTRTVEYLTEQFSMSIESVSRFGLSANDAARVNRALADLLSEKSTEWHNLPQDERTGSIAERAAAIMILGRTTMGCPKAWGSMELGPLEEAEYRKILYDNNLDLLFHRICYWADGRRSLLDIVDRLEIEFEALRRDTSISRTSTDTAIDASSTGSIDLDAVLYIVDKLVESGYLRIAAD